MSGERPSCHAYSAGHEAWARLFCCWCGRLIHNPGHRAGVLLHDMRHTVCPHCIGKALGYPKGWLNAQRIVRALGA